MNREPWVVYITVILVVVGMMYGKYLIGKGDEEDEEKK